MVAAIKSTVRLRVWKVFEVCHDGQRRRNVHYTKCFRSHKDKDDTEVDVLNGLLFDESSPVENLVETCFQVSEQVQETKSLKDTCRNITLVADEELEKLKETHIPNNTRISTNWAVRTWKEWEGREISCKTEQY